MANAVSTPEAEAYKSLQEQMKDLRERMVSAASALFKSGADTFFTKYPQIESFYWTQYTPFFNDGDTCEFGVNSDVYIIFAPKGVEQEVICEDDECECEEYDEDDEEPREMYDYNESEPEWVMFREISSFVASFEEADLHAIFGDHAKVSVTRAGVEVDTYEHD